jgi:hypothetical protein
MIDVPNNSHKGAQCVFCSQSWKRGKPTDMKAHLALKCSMVNHNVKLEYLRTISNEDVLEQTIQNQLDNNNDNNVADTAKINKALIRFFVCCGIPFSVVDSPFFQDFVKSLCYKYELPGRTTLSGNYLDAEIANITLKIEEELRFSKNLTLGKRFILFYIFYIL